MVTEKKRMKLLVGLIVLVLTAIVVLLIVYAAGGRGKAAAPSAVTPRPAQEVVVREKEVEKIVTVEKEISSAILTDGVRELGLLVTDEYYFTEVVSFSSIKKLLGIEWKFTESSFLASYDGVVEAGIDCTKITVEKDEEQKTILVTLPAAEARPANVDPNSLVVYSEKEGTGNRISVEDYNNSLIALESAAGQKAIDRGLLERADANAETLVRAFVGSLVDLSQYQLTIRRA